MEYVAAATYGAAKIKTTNQVAPGPPAPAARAAGLDDELLSKAAYLQPTRDFERTLATRTLGGVLIWLLIIAVLALASAACSVAIGAAFPRFAHARFVGPLLVFPALLARMVLRWRKYFSALPTKLEQESILRKPLPRGPDPVPMSMRPLKISLWQFISCYARIYPPFMLSAAYWFFLKLPGYGRWNRQFARRKATPARSVEEAFGLLMLENSTMMWFHAASEEKGGALLGHFSSEHFGPIRTLLVQKEPAASSSDDDGLKYHDIGRIEVWVDLRARRAVRASFDGVDVALVKAFVQVTFVMSLQSHAWLHSVCTWAVCPNHAHWYVARASAMTLIFNHMGFDGGFPIATRVTGRREFLEAGNARTARFADRLPHLDELYMLGPFQTGVPDFFGTPRAAALTPYSRFCAFAHLLHPVFLRACDDEPRPITDSPEALFYNTVLHPLDHWIFSKLFASSAEALAIVLQYSDDAAAAATSPLEPHIDYAALGTGANLALCLTDDWPKSFGVHFRDAPRDIAFYRKVYGVAKSIDPELAYHLQSCIIK